MHTDLRLQMLIFYNSLYSAVYYLLTLGAFIYKVIVNCLDDTDTFNQLNSSTKAGLILSLRLSLRSLSGFQLPLNPSDLDLVTQAICVKQYVLVH